jgi:hypothetical protein
MGGKIGLDSNPCSSSKVNNLFEAFSPRAIYFARNSISTKHLTEKQDATDTEIEVKDHRYIQIRQP